MELHGLVPNSYIHVSVSDLYIPRIGPPFGCSKIDRLIWEYINCSQIHECGNRETEHYKSVLEIMRPPVSFWGSHKSELDIYIGFSPALHLQCVICTDAAAF